MNEYERLFYAPVSSCDDIDPEEGMSHAAILARRASIRRTHPGFSMQAALQLIEAEKAAEPLVIPLFGSQPEQFS